MSVDEVGVQSVRLFQILAIADPYGSNNLGVNYPGTATTYFGLSVLYVKG